MKMDEFTKYSRSISLLMVMIFTVAWVSISAGQQDHSSIDSTSLHLKISYLAESDTAKNPLKPPDTSSPRATLISFLDNMNRSYRVLMEAQRKNIETPGLFTSDSAQHMAVQAEELFKRGVTCLNLSKISKAFRRTRKHEATLQLKEILDRIDLPPFHQIPDAQAVQKEQEEKKFPKLHHWQIPNTDIEIARVNAGPRMGEYLFAPETVARLAEFYKRIEDISYKSDVPISEGFFEFYISNPGRLLPPKWSQWLPDWSNQLFISQTIWQWCALVIIFTAAIFFVMGVYRVVLSRVSMRSPSGRSWRWVVFYLMTILTLSSSGYILDEQINISGSIFIVLRTILSPVFWLLLSAIVFFIGRAIAESIIDSPKIDPEGIQASYIRAVFGLFGFLAASTVFIFGLSRIGVSLIPLLTGVGIGGLAIALAARPTIANIIGSFMIFADNPYRVGQRVNVMGQNGTVESIGLRSTKIRLLTGPLTVIPNEKMAAVEIENIGQRPYIRRTFNITLTYDTPPEKINRAVDLLHDILAVPEPVVSKKNDSAHAEESTKRQRHYNEAINRPDFPPRVYFNEFNPDSLNIVVHYWYHPPIWWNYSEHAHNINLQIMERFNAEGIDFAFPTQTLHLAGDEKHPLKLDQHQISKK